LVTVNGYSIMWHLEEFVVCRLLHCRNFSHIHSLVSRYHSTVFKSEKFFIIKTIALVVGHKSRCYLLFLPGPDAGTGLLDFKPTPEIPALQYFESMLPGGAAERAGLQPGDYLLEVILCFVFLCCLLLKSLNIRRLNYRMLKLVKVVVNVSNVPRVSL